MKQNPCDRWRESIYLLASGALSEGDEADAREHVASCADCRKLFNEVKSMALPLANWEKDFAAVEPSRAVQGRWADTIHAAAKSGRVRVGAPPGFVHQFWRELFWPCRHALAGLATLWLVMGAINSGMFNSQSGITLAHAPVPPALWENLEEQKQMLAELIQTPDRQPADRPPKSPRPRSEKPAPQKFC